jgi:hypothetical protein
VLCAILYEYGPGSPGLSEPPDYYRLERPNTTCILPSPTGPARPADDRLDALPPRAPRLPLILTAFDIQATIRMGGNIWNPSGASMPCASMLPPWSGKSPAPLAPPYRSRHRRWPLRATYRHNLAEHVCHMYRPVRSQYARKQPPRPRQRPLPSRRGRAHTRSRPSCTGKLAQNTLAGPRRAARQPTEVRMERLTGRPADSGSNGACGAS